MLYLALMLLVGLPIGLAAVVLPVFRRESIRAQHVLASSKRWLIAAAALLVVGAIAFFAAQVIPLELAFTTIGEWAEFVQQSLLGQMLLARVGLGLIALLMLLLTPRPGVWLIACVVIGLLAQATTTRTSHSAAMAEGWLPVATDYAHLIAGALWGGGLAALLIALCTPLLGGEGVGVGETHSLIKRFSPLGMAGAAIAVGTGLALSSLHIPNAGALRDTDYGALLLLKVAAVIAAMALAGLHKFVTLRHMTTARDVQSFRRTLGIEAAVVIGVFVLAALLVAAPPPHKSMSHQMVDGSTMMMSLADPEFERSLLIAALVILAAGAVALALEWREHKKTQL